MTWRLRGRFGERGHVALYAVLLFPVLMLVFALVLTVGTLEAQRARLRAQLDIAALTATQALDFEALARGEEPRLMTIEADRLAREYLARNLVAMGGTLSPAAISAAAEVAVLATGETHPLTGAAVEAPTVAIRASVPTDLPLLTLVGMSPTVTVTVSGSAGART